MKRALVVAVGLALLSMMAMIPIAQADVLGPEDFETFNTGSPNGQSDWIITGAGYDVEIVDPGDSFAMGDRALRISNAVMSGSFGDWLYSEPLVDPAGEAGSVGDGLTGATREERFDATFDFVSTMETEQPDLQFSVSPDRGDGARMSYLRFEDTPGGIQVVFSDYIDAHPLGGQGGDGCAANDDFQSDIIATLDRASTHEVHITMEFLAGPANDRVFVWIDGNLAHVGTSWEDYFRYCEGNPTRPVDSLLFRAGGSGTNPGVDGKGFLIDDITIESGPIPADGTAGSWSQYPAGGTQYVAQILPPINATGTSNWSSKSKGGIPVMFRLSAGSSAAVFESVGSDIGTANDYAYASFAPSSDLIFGDIQTLMTDYLFTEGNCHGGSLRWSVGSGVDTNGDGKEDHVFIYYGDSPNFTDCTTDSQSGVNMVGWSDVRYDTSQFLGGNFYDTYAHALSLMDTSPVTSVSLVLDSGWQGAPNGDQRADVSGITVNDEVYEWVGGEASPMATTCDLPAADIAVDKYAGSPTGPVNEEPVQPSLADDGNAFRVVDCKYQYILSIPSLAGPGSYHAGIEIGGQEVGFGEFELKQ